MISRSRVWLAAAVVFTLVNLGGAGFAAVMGDPFHLATHAVLLLPGIYLVRRFAGRDARSVGRGGEAGIPAGSPELGDRLSRLEQAIDTVAIEVGRMGDGQRLMTRFVTETTPSQVDADGRQSHLIHGVDDR